MKKKRIKKRASFSTALSITVLLIVGSFTGVGAIINSGLLTSNSAQNRTGNQTQSSTKENVTKTNNPNINSNENKNITKNNDPDQNS